MRRLVSLPAPAVVSTLLAIVVLTSALSAVPAQAVSLMLTAVARVHVTSGMPSSVTFSARTSRTARVTVSVYRGSALVRRLNMKKVGGSYTTSWNLRDSLGRTVGLGTYSYRITAVAGVRSSSMRRWVSLNRSAGPVASASLDAAPHAVPSAPLPAVAPAVTPAPASAPAPAPVPVSAAVPAPAAQPIPAAASDVSARWVGFYMSGNLMPDTSALAQLESQTGVHSGVVNMFLADTDTFPASRVKAVSARGSIPMVTLEFWSTKTGGVSAITNGAYDTRLRAFADAAKASGKQIWLRPLHEMNGNWYPWAGGTSGNSPAQVIAAYRHVHDLFVSCGATNVKFVWCVNNESVPNNSANAIASYWPGDGYVDYLAIDAYNFGTYQPTTSWRTFSSAMSGAYSKVTALSSKPLFVAETGSVEQGGNKATWIAEMFRAIPASFPRITGVCWFNVLDGEDWRVNSSASSLSAFKAGAAAF